MTVRDFLQRGDKIVRETYDDEFGQTIWYAHGIFEIAHNTDLYKELRHDEGLSDRNKCLIWESLPVYEQDYESGTRSRSVLVGIRAGC